MRPLPMITALLVCAALYLIVFERDRVMGLADSAPQEASAADAPPVQDDSAGQVSVVAMTSRAQPLDGAVLLRGQTEAYRHVELRSETTGTVVSQPRRGGAQVAEGEVLCLLDEGTRPAALTEAEARVPEAEARLAEARARLAEAEINANAATQLSVGGYASDSRVAGAEAQLVAARAGVQSAQAALKAAAAGAEASARELARTRLVAPFAGVLEQDAAETGSLLATGGLCATIFQFDPIKLVGFVPETDVDRIAVGALAGARLVSGREVRGEVTFVSRAADPSTRTFRTEITVPNPDLSIRDGQTAEILIAAAGSQAHLLPASALTLDDGGRLGVRIVAEGRAQFTPVEALRDTPKGIWVSGLPDQAEVIVVGQEYVTDGVPLAVTLRDAETAP